MFTSSRERGMDVDLSAIAVMLGAEGRAVRAKCRWCTSRRRYKVMPFGMVARPLSGSRAVVIPRQMMRYLSPMQYCRRVQPSTAKFSSL